MTIKKIIAIALSLVMITTSLTACGASSDSSEFKTDKNNFGQESTTLKEDKIIDVTIKIDQNKEYQTIEGFGASGAWWSQAIGTWDKVDKDGIEVKDRIATLLFDPVDGIGLNTYRYNIGAGSKDEGKKSAITDTWRSTQSFETSDGAYDWTRDAGSVWFMQKAVELGVNNVIMFCNSPLERLTKSGMAYADANSDNFSNLPEENCDEFAKYVYDVAEHFIAEGIPVKEISPINEPQWDWTGGQEGCHYSESEMVTTLKKFIDMINQRPALSEVKISAPELGEWGNTSSKYFLALFNDEQLKNYYSSIDCHSYWSEKSTKVNMSTYLYNQNPDLKLRMSEWCEMKNGKDLTMDSALVMAKCMHEDLTILDVVSWQYWIAVSCYDYRDGLIYVNKNTKGYADTKRLWTLGNYSKFIKAGYIRVDTSSSDSSVLVSAYKGSNNGKEELVMVLTNNQEANVNVPISIDSSYTKYSVHVTDADKNLECTVDGAELTNSTSILLTPQSVTTIVLNK